MAGMNKENKHNDMSTPSRKKENNLENNGEKVSLKEPNHDAIK